MKKVLMLILSVFITANIIAQSPGAFNYQAVARDAAGDLIINTTVGIQISVLYGSPTGPSVYTEFFTPATNTFGLLNLEVGNGTVVGGNFSEINWSTGPYYLKVEIDVTGGTNYTSMGASQLLSVPYALFATSVENDNVDDADADPLNEIQTLGIEGSQLSLSNGGGTVALPVFNQYWNENRSNIFFNTGMVGIGTNQTYSLLHINNSDGASDIRISDGYSSSDGINIGVDGEGEAFIHQNNLAKSLNIGVDAVNDAININYGGHINIKQNLNVESEITSNTTGGKNCVASAYGWIYNTGDKATTYSTDNFTSEKINTGEFKITFTDITAPYIPVVTPHSHGGNKVTLTAGIGVSFMYVYCYDISTGNPVDIAFTFVVFDL